MISPANMHTSHCCVQHGCKYGDNNCPVTKLQAKQNHECSQCCRQKEQPEHVRVKNLQKLLKRAHKKANTLNRNAKPYYPTYH